MGGSQRGGCIVPCVYRHAIGARERFPELVQVFRPTGDGEVRTYRPEVTCVWTLRVGGGFASGCGHAAPVTIGTRCPFCGGRMERGWAS